MLVTELTERDWALLKAFRVPRLESWGFDWDIFPPLDKAAFGTDLTGTTELPDMLDVRSLLPPSGWLYFQFSGNDEIGAGLVTVEKEADGSFTVSSSFWDGADDVEKSWTGIRTLEEALAVVAQYAASVSHELATADA